MGNDLVAWITGDNAAAGLASRALLLVDRGPLDHRFWTEGGEEQ